MAARLLVISEEDENHEEEENPKGKGKGRAGSGRAAYQEQSEAEGDEENNSDAKPLASKSSKARKKGPSKPVLKVIPDPRDLLLTPPNLDTAALPKNYLKTLLKVRSEVCAHCERKQSDCHQSSGRTWKCQDCQTSRKLDCSWAVGKANLSGNY